MKIYGILLSKFTPKAKKLGDNVRKVEALMSPTNVERQNLESSKKKKKMAPYIQGNPKKITN